MNPSGSQPLTAGSVTPESCDVADPATHLWWVRIVLAKGNDKLHANLQSHRLQV